MFFPVRSEPALLASRWLGDAAWTTTMGDRAAQSERDLAVFAECTSVVVGSTSGRLDFAGKMLSGAQTTTPFVVKLDAAGKPLDPAGALRTAIRVAEANGLDVPSLVVDSAGRALLAGHSAGSLFLTEIDRSSAELRTRSFGCDAWPPDLAVARQGPRDVVLASTFTDAIDLGKAPIRAAGATDLLLTKLRAF